MQVENTIALFKEGATVPFIARYRKERTGELDEVQIRELQHKHEYYSELEERRTAILESIESQGKLTPELKAQIEGTISKTEIEDLYLPYKPKRTTRGKKALEAGLEPLARWLVEQTESTADPAAKAAEFLNTEQGFDTAEKALQGACDILAEELSDDAEVRKWLRELAAAEGGMVSVVRKEFAGQKTKFEMYYDFREAVKNIPSHRYLALLRGEREKVLRVELEFSKEKAGAYLEGRLIKHANSASVGYLHACAADALDRLLLTATETEIRKELRERAEAEAFTVFGENLRALLLAPPAGHKRVLGVDPGFRSGCKVVAVDDTGKFLDFQAIFPHEPQKQTDKAAATLRTLIDSHGIELIAIGNGTAGRETEKFVRDAVAGYPADKRPLCVIVNESGASVYSASELAGKEFPDFDVTVRGAVSIARRLQDPLSELVKIDPKAIGVGQYQHDVNQSTLKKSLEEVVESCVNTVGVDLNLASEELLKHVAGLNRTVAAKIVGYRNEHGAFRSRAALKKVSGLGEKTFEQAAGFLRIRGGDDPLDNSAVHPERYSLVAAMAETLRTSVAKMVGDVGLIKALDAKRFVTGDVGLPTIVDILAELEKPGRDPRQSFTYATFNDAVSEISHLKPGMRLEGTVTNVTNFGAFVDIGVHQDGLVHISQLSDRYVTDPRAVVKVGQVVKVRVVEVDETLKRIALSMKSEQSPGAPAGPGSGQALPAARPQSRQPAPADLRPKGQAGGQPPLKTYKPKFSVKQFMK
jgi:uncharacterized protein